ncbi:MAG TPA: hypothetical protein PLO37_13625 [Candidatus Hydrogenedentes bacterium]|nr:hypothetical protein [Candidatus Hydrogenedentota bacterium]HPG67884.1 hypothetical protein [Candidatus Hydrogenedentota bacterium]
MDKDPHIARMKDYFVRHVAWLEEWLKDAASREGDRIDTNTEAVLEREAQYAVELAGFQREFDALIKEWGAAEGVDPEGRAEVSALAQRARKLAERAAAILEQARLGVEDRQQTVAKALGQLRQGRGLLEKYRPHVAGDGDWIDKKA